MPSRRQLLTGTAFALIGGFVFKRFFGDSAIDHAMAATGTPEIVKTDEEWKKQLTAEQYHVLRQHGTEYPGTSPLNKEKRRGTFACAGCDLPLFSSDTKFESGTGWPSFWQPLANAVGTRVDRSMMMVRTEVHCRRCIGHLGHVFEDGPKHLFLYP